MVKDELIAAEIKDQGGSSIGSNEFHQPLKIKKIAMLGTFPPLRGLSSYCFELASAVARRINVDFISFKKLYPRFLYPGGNLKEDHTFPELNIRGLKISRRITWYNPLTWLFEATVSRAELLHAQWWSLPLSAIYLCICGIFKLRGKPVVLTVHNVFSHGHSRIFKAASRLLFGMADHFIVHTEKNRLQLIHGYGVSNGHISVIPHGTLDFHIRDQVNPAAVRKELGIGLNRKVVLLFGAIRPYKGIDTAIKALARVVLDVPDAMLIIAGKLWQSWAPYKRLIDSLAIGNSVKTFLEYVPSGEVYKYFEAADLVVLPYEQFDSQSGVGSTAVSFRKPMIVSDVGGLPDLVRNRRWVVPPQNPAALARAIVACLTQPNLLLDMADDTKNVADQLGWANIAENTIALYDKLIGGSDNIRKTSDKRRR